MAGRTQFRLPALFIVMAIAAFAAWLFLISRNLFIIFCVSVVPAAATLWCFSKCRNEKHQQGTRTKTTLALIELSICFLVVYFHGVGPVIYVDTIYIHNKPGDSTPEFITNFYTPISMSIHPANPLSNALDWYILQWEKAAGIERVAGFP